MSTSQTASSAGYSPALDNLRTLLVIRSIALLGQIGVLAYVMLASRTTEDPRGLAASLVLLTLLTVASLWRCTRSWPVTEQEFMAQLLVDVAGWTCLMYFSGGASNPFISYYIVPLVISAAVLPWRYTWVIAAASLAGYSTLLYYYQPFPLFTPHAHSGHGGQVHVLGMWFNFLFSAGLITYFVVRMAATLRRQEAEAVARREDDLRNDQIMAVARLAAGTAHELGTPLGTLAMLVESLQDSGNLDPESRADARLMQDQIRLCKQTLQQLTSTGQLSSIADVQQRPLLEWLSETTRSWALRRPQVRCELHCDPAQASPLLCVDITLGQALENLLNNAANTDSERIIVDADWSDERASITVRDFGPGIASDILQRVGKPVLQASTRGLGLGLLLTHATVERYGGSITLRNADGGGTLATLSLPLQVVDHG